MENSSITPQEVAAYYANALNAKQIMNQRRAKMHGRKWETLSPWYAQALIPVS